MVVLLVAMLFPPLLSFARVGDLPEIMVGQTTVTDDVSRTFYGGMSGNEVVLNYVPTDSADTATRYFGFTHAPLETCSEHFLPLPLLCYNANKTTDAVKVMNSETTISGIKFLEVSTLLYASATVSGDVYGNLSNFAFWGRNLQYSNAIGSDPTWRTGSYVIADSQSKWKGADFAKFLEKAKTLYREGVRLPVSSFAGTGYWYLQNKSNSLATPFNDAKAFPEGKAWSVDGPLSIDGDIKYSGIGTLIVRGSLTVREGVQILPDPTVPNSHLGIIVLGDTADSTICTFLRKVNINASVFCQQQMEVYPYAPNGSTFVGAFVASKIYSSNPLGNSFVGDNNMRFTYTPLTADETPPGFRYLNLPTATQ